MPATYSINIGTPYESDRLATIQDVLNQIPDNVDKIVTPHIVRNSIFSTWENSVFKQTTGSSSEYIGIDKDDIYNRVYFGKKSLLGNDIMSSSLLSSDTDTFFFNNKSNSNLSQQGTKVSFLAGTNSSLYSSAPYIRTRVAIGPSSSQVVQFDINNNSGNINVYSTNRVYINDIGFPSISETIASASNNSILSYDTLSGGLYWKINTFTTSTIGTSSSSTSIVGSPVNINGYNIELTDGPVINQVGSIKQGKSFKEAVHTELSISIKKFERTGLFIIFLAASV